MPFVPLFSPEQLTWTAPHSRVHVLTDPPKPQPMPAPNFENRTLFTADNLDIMRGMNSETVDLIATDPPFNSKKNYAAALGTKAAGAVFTDTWSLDDVKKEWVEALQSDNTATWSAITAAGYIHGESSQAYLTYMAIRLLEMRRILKPTGSIYLHCDPTMSHYLKALMDAIFGRLNFTDTWSLDDVKKEWVEALQSDNTATWSAITAAGYIHGESSQAYLTYMAIRLLEMRRIEHVCASNASFPAQPPLGASDIGHLREPRIHPHSGTRLCGAIPVVG